MPFFLQTVESSPGEYNSRHIFALESPAFDGVLVTEATGSFISNPPNRPTSAEFTLEGAGPLSAVWQVNNLAASEAGVSITLLDGAEQDAQQLSWEEFLPGS